MSDRPTAPDPARFEGFREVADPRWGPPEGSLGWIADVEGVPRLLLGRPDQPECAVIGPPVRSTGSTRGGTWCWAGRRDLLVITAAGSLVRVALPSEDTVEVLPADGSRFVGPVVDPDGWSVALTRETPTAMDVIVAPLSGGDPVTVSTADFAWDPAWSPAGDALAWHEWDHPDMPWDSSRIVVAPVVDHVVGAPVVVAGGPDEQVGQPRFSPDGRHLAWVSDRDGVLRVWVGDAMGRDAHPIASDPYEAAEAPWGAGQRSFAWSPDSTEIAWCRNEDGFGALVRASVDGSGPVVEVAKAWHHSLDWLHGGIVAVRSGARTPPRITIAYPGEPEYFSYPDDEPVDRIEIDDGDPDGFVRDGLVEPEVVAWDSDGRRITGLLSVPAAVPAPVPLVVDLHGGPTGAATVRWNADVAALTQQWAVLRPNPRGSTGSGRAHLRALDGGWGAADLGDVIAGIEAVIARPEIDASRVAVMGGSAGGMLALLVALRRPDLVHACVVSYAVTDLRDLAAVEYRFEQHYTDRLVGRLPEAEATYIERSPITHAASLRVPTLMFHGDSDPVVPIGQMMAFAETAREAGADVRTIEYPDEGHGFRRTVGEDAARRTRRFLEEQFRR